MCNWQAHSNHSVTCNTFHSQLLRDQEPSITPEQYLETAMEEKKCYTYVCPDLVKEFCKYGMDGPSGLNSMLDSRQSLKEFSTDVGYGRSLGSKIFFIQNF